MKRFFVLGENTLCAVSDKPDFGQFLQGELSFPLTVLASYNPLLCGVVQSIHPKGSPMLRLANKADIISFMGQRASDMIPAIEKQEQETALSAQALTELAATVSRDFSVQYERILKDIDMFSELPPLMEQEAEALSDCHRNALINAVVVADLFKEHDRAIKRYISDSDIEIINAINDAVNAILSCPIDTNPPEIDPAVVARANSKMQADFGSMPNDVMPTLCDRSLKVYEGILKSHQIMQSQHRLRIVLTNFIERYQRLAQEHYNFCVLRKLFEQHGDGLSAGAISAQDVDWVSLSHYREHINDAIQISDNLLAKYNKERENYRAALGDTEPNVMG